MPLILVLDPAPLTTSLIALLFALIHVLDSLTGTFKRLGAVSLFNHTYYCKLQTAARRQTQHASLRAQAQRRRHPARRHIERPRNAIHLLISQEIGKARCIVSIAQAVNRQSADPLPSLRPSSCPACAFEVEPPRCPQIRAFAAPTSFHQTSSLLDPFHLFIRTRRARALISHFSFFCQRVEPS